MALLNSNESKRLHKAKIMWLATVSQKSIPHLVPVWFVLIENKIYVSAGYSSVKVKQIIDNPYVAFSLEDGINPLICNGRTNIRSVDEKDDSLIIAKFKEKYNWNISDEEANILLEIEITKVLQNGQ